MSENFGPLSRAFGITSVCGLQHLAQERRFLVLTPYIALSSAQNVFLHRGIVSIVDSIDGL